MKIAAGNKVLIHYQLFNQAGELFESSEGQDPVDFVQGEGEVPPGLERALEGKAAGDSLRIELEKSEAFGPYLPEGLVSLPREDLPDELEKGDVLPLVLTDDDGNELDDGDLEARVIEIKDDEVVLDANHPLAGQDVTFEVEVVEVEAP